MNLKDPQGSLASEKRQTIIFRLVYLLFTLIFAALVMWPIYQDYREFPFAISNIVFMLVTSLGFFWLFFRRWSLIVGFKWFKVIAILASPFIFFYCYRIINDFNFYADRNMILDDLYSLKYQKQDWLASYVRLEYLLTGVAAVITIVLVTLNFIRLTWLQINNR